VAKRRSDSHGSAFRAAASDFYYQSTRLVPANVAWGAGLLAIVAFAAWGSALGAVVVAPLLCLPLVGIARLAAQAVRGEDVVLSDAIGAARTNAIPALAAGAAATVAASVLVVNVIGGIASGGPFGWALAVLAAWGLIGLWLVCLAFWPLLVDPARDGVAVIAKARLAVFVILAEPLRFARLGAALAVIGVLSAIAIVTLLSVSVAFMLLVAARTVLPAADRLEAMLADAGEGRTPSAPVSRAADAVATAPVTPGVNGSH
jgi:hypothetical protein